MRLQSLRASVTLTLTALLLMVAAPDTKVSAQTYEDLHNFGSGTDGSTPLGILAQGVDGNLYGTTQQGGANGCGVVFKMTPAALESVLYNFEWQYGGDNFNGCGPWGGVSLGRGGTMYGTATYGGSSENCAGGCGTVFSFTPSGTLTGIFSFHTCFCGPGVFPLTPPILGVDGGLYGSNFGFGEAPFLMWIYRITPSGSLTTLANVGSQAPLVQATNGNFYGTSPGGGTLGDGYVFEMTPQGTLTTVYNFDGTHGASLSYGALILGSDGNFYGTTQQGGSYGDGVVFQLTPQGVITVLHNFGDPNYPNDGTGPSAGLIQATDGNFYGVTTTGGTQGYGELFKVTQAGAYSILYNFDNTHGANPESTLFQHTNGKLYGLATAGGSYGVGVVYGFDLGLAPFVSLIPGLGKPGNSISILGQGFTGTTSVSFNGTAANFTIVSDTSLEVTVPAGVTTGLVTVITPGGALTSNQKFHVIP